MKKVILGLLALGLTIPVFTQDVKVEELSEVVIRPMNFKYLNATNSKTAAIPVKMLERAVASYDVTEADFYQDDFEFYTVSFFIPDGKIVAEYDNDGKIIRTIEKFKNITLPNDVKTAVLKRFPNWTVTKDVYRVTYTEDNGATKVYKLMLKNGDKKMRVKVDDIGTFL
ncbi:nicotinate-nucleotide adenylyltransferase [uncultured Muriicola sp.]|uniref:nicotinate-nucleotide adenylyltransferase n=1 Tax=uncultured Muriicola sp. TaxID=1583102 RepID=UPI00261CA6C1|nr:nicotinate-nucleotide adenylyltransferase [uncultured Muriicola sp.]